LKLSIVTSDGVNSPSEVKRETSSFYQQDPKKTDGKNYLKGSEAIHNKSYGVI